MKKTLSAILAAVMAAGAVSVSPAAFAEDTTPTKLPGDINLDSSVDVQDAIYLFRNTILPDLYPLNYSGNVDYVSDGSTDIQDAIYLFRYTMLPDLYPLPLTYTLTENGKAKSHIVIFDGADAKEQTAASDLAYHISLISGAEVPVTNAVEDGSLPIIIATPDSHPELEELFPEDLAWLRTLTEETENGKRNWGDDGFAVREHDGKIYIFGATAKGAMNGTYDFIEENMDVIWTQAEEELGLVYDENPTITAEKINYREKSPFQIRGWTLDGGIGDAPARLYARNKLSTVQLKSAEDLGISIFPTAHNVKNLVLNSPIYDPNVTEYWNTDDFGNPLAPEDSNQVNFWSDKAAEAVAATVIEAARAGVVADAVGGQYGYFIGMMDTGTGKQIPESKQPFEYAPGQFVEPKQGYLFNSTVWFSFINKIARMVDEACPGTRIVTFSYSFTERPPLCEIEDNVTIVFAPLDEDLRHSFFNADNRPNKSILKKLEEWKTITDKIVIYNYYGCFTAAPYYTRPIWDKVQEHLQYYAEAAFYGVQPEGHPDTDTIWWQAPDGKAAGTPLPNFSDAWDMNCMTYWIYSKLCWNPYEDVDALIVEFCDKYYGGASEYMQEYYRLTMEGWVEGTKTYPSMYDWASGYQRHMDYFIFNENFEEPLYVKLLDALNNAWEAANDIEKERIRYIKERMEENIRLQFSYNLTENGQAASHIVISETADSTIQAAASELAYHMNLISGAEIPVTNAVTEGSLPIIIATPDSLPELEELFPEDLAWLRTLSEETENGKRNWGDDGFAVRDLDGKIYIFGANSKGALNGTYDFIEDNMGVLWARNNEATGLIYNETPNILASKTSYREKSPFQVRGWHFSARSDQPGMIDILARNKLNNQSGATSEEKGIKRFSVSHNVKALVYNSPLYDPEVTEYWNTDGLGNPLTYEDSPQVNFWSDKTAEAIAATIIAYIREGLEVPLMAPGDYGIFIGMEDVSTGYQLPYSRQPFEYAPGQFVDYKQGNLFYSTVWFTFINKIARMVNEECPGTTIATFAYNFTTRAPACEVDENVLVVYAPLNEDLTASLFDSTNKENKKIFNTMEGWKAVTDNFFIYNYYGCFASADRYTRPIWDTIQEHMQYYAESGFFGVQPEGAASDDGNMYWFAYNGEGDYVAGGETTVPNSATWDMNGMIYWLYGKLCWNPYEDVDALIKEYCDKYYGGASEYMQEYYRLIKKGWNEGSKTLPSMYDWFRSFTLHMENFILNPNFEEPIHEDIMAALNNAWDAANDVEKERIRYIKETMEDSLNYFLNK